MFKTTVCHATVDAPNFVINKDINRDLVILSMSELTIAYSTAYSLRLNSHPNVLGLNLLDNSEQTSRLNRTTPLDLPLGRSFY